MKRQWIFILLLVILIPGEVCLGGTGKIKESNNRNLCIECTKKEKNKKGYRIINPNEGKRKKNPKMLVFSLKKGKKILRKKEMVEWISMQAVMVQWKGEDGIKEERVEEWTKQTKSCRDRQLCD